MHVRSFFFVTKCEMSEIKEVWVVHSIKNFIHFKPEINIHGTFSSEESAQQTRDSVIKAYINTEEKKNPITIIRKNGYEVEEWFEGRCGGYSVFMITHTELDSSSSSLQSDDKSSESID